MKAPRSWPTLDSFHTFKRTFIICLQPGGKQWEYYISQFYTTGSSLVLSHPVTEPARLVKMGTSLNKIKAKKLNNHMVAAMSFVDMLAVLSRKKRSAPSHINN